MSPDPDRPRVAPESGRPAASDDPLTTDSTVSPDEDTGGAERPDQDLFERLRELGWNGKPFVTHAGEVVGERELYEIAERMGVADKIPRVDLEEVFLEAGIDLEELIEESDRADDPGRAYFEDYMRTLPRHIRDKYGI